MVNELNQLLEDDTYTYTWDHDGNLAARTEKAAPSRVTAYTFNTENRLVRVTLPDGGIVAFTYDIAGRRIARVMNNVLTTYAYVGINIAAEYDFTLNPNIYYINGPGIDNILAASHNDASFYYLKDAVNSVYLITNSQSFIVHSYEYDSFGNIVSSVGTINWNTITFTGREWDSILKAHFYRKRYYSSISGSFLSEDLSWQINLFKYVNNNPLIYIDPLGLDADPFANINPNGADGTVYVPNVNHEPKKTHPIPGMAQLKSHIYNTDVLIRDLESRGLFYDPTIPDSMFGHSVLSDITVKYSLPDTYEDVYIAGLSYLYFKGAGFLLSTEGKVVGIGAKYADEVAVDTARADKLCPINFDSVITENKAKPTYLRNFVLRKQSIFAYGPLGSGRAPSSQKAVEEFNKSMELWLKDKEAFEAQEAFRQMSEGIVGAPQEYFDILNMYSAMRYGPNTPSIRPAQ